jgi:hypothetical protein
LSGIFLYTLQQGIPHFPINNSKADANNRESLSRFSSVSTANYKEGRQAAQLMVAVS